MPPAGLHIKTDYSRIRLQCKKIPGQWACPRFLTWNLLQYANELGMQRPWEKFSS
jgi:hypothetical protein